MDKQRCFLTWMLAVVATAWSQNDSFWWAEAKILPLCVTAVIIENFRSAWQNNK